MRIFSVQRKEAGGMAENTKQNLQPTAVIARLYGVDPRRIQQLNAAGIIKGHGRPAMYDLLPTIQALFQYQRQLIEGTKKEQEIAELEKTKLKAETDIKKAKAEIANLERDELAGKLHRAEDVEAITTDHVLFLRSMLMAMPGKLAVDLGGTHTAAEQAERVKQEVYYILDQLADYKYDPETYKKRVRERQGWENNHKDDDVDG